MGMIPKNDKKILKLLLIIFCFEIDRNYLEYIKKNLFINPNLSEYILKIFIMAHKDFINYRYNSVYNIVVDDKYQLQNKYNLNIINANQTKLYNMRRAYCEMAKIYFIYNLYKKGEIFSKYVGINHYRRYFDFTDNIPDIENIFKIYDVILIKPFFDKDGIRDSFCKAHICEIYDEMIDIIKHIKPEYYKSAIKASKYKNIYCCNIFIMKRRDFLNYCEFMFDVLFELDRRYNLNSDKDVYEFVKKHFNDNITILYQSRMEAFLSERISNIFYYHHFKRIKSFPVGNFKGIKNNHFLINLINLIMKNENK